VSDACFFCVTPYQIMCAIAIVKDNGINADLYIAPSFDCELLVRRLNIMRIFESVYVLDEEVWFSFRKGNKALRRLRMIVKYLFFKRSIKEYLNIGGDYSKFYYSGTTFEASLFLVYLSVSGATINYYDDGYISYGERAAHEFKLRHKIAFLLFFGKRGLVPVEQRWLYFPELYRILHPEDGRSINKIHNIWNKCKMQQQIRFIFGLKENAKLDEKVILLDVVKNEILTKQGIVELQQLYSMICDCIGGNSVLIKKHPRDKSADYFDVKYSVNSKIPFEVETMGVDMNDKLLISFASTSVVTPKLLKDEEPYVLLLYKLVKCVRDTFVDRDKFYSAVKSLYHNPDRFMIPESISELKDCLCKLEESGLC